MKLYKYKDYDEYVRIQTEANRRKIKGVWVRESDLKKLSGLIDVPSTILCHGTRNGRELEIFQELYPEAEVLGTEISDTATQFPNTVQHDFHDVNQKWIGKYDLVYSNSFDHAYDPKKAISAWRDQLSYNGKLVIEWSLRYEVRSGPVDPLAMLEDEFIDLMQKTGMVIINSFMSSHPKKSKIYIMQKRAE